MEKAVKYVIKGEVQLTDEMTLEEAMAHLRESVTKLQELASARLEVSVPRLTRMKVEV